MARGAASGETGPSAEALQLMLDKFALQELVQTYCRAIDRRDFALLATLYHPDSVDDHGGMFKGSGPDFVRWVPSMLAHFEATDHTATSTLFTVSGDLAEGEIHVVAYHRGPGPKARETIIHGRYLDIYERREGVWRFLARSLVYDWSTVRVIDEQAVEAVSRGVMHGRADERDPLYERFNLTRRGPVAPWH